MASIQNERTLRLQATVPRIVVVPIAIGDVAGLPQALKRITLRASTTTIFGDEPASVTISATRHNGVAGTMEWSTSAGTLLGSGDSRTIPVNTIPLGGNAVVQASADGVGISIVINRVTSNKDIVNANHVYVAGEDSSNAVVYMYHTGSTHGELGVKGAFTAKNSSGATLMTSFGNTIRLENAVLQLNVTSLTGTMGATILRKGVTYQVSVDGGAPQSVVFS